MSGAAPRGVAPGRLERLSPLLEEAGLDALLVSHPANVRYLCGFSGSAGYLVAGLGVPLLLVDGRYGEQAEQEVGGSVEVRVAGDGLLAGAARAAAERGGSARVGIEAEHVTVRQRERLEEEAGEVGWAASRGLVEELRARKDPEEVERIEGAARIASESWEVFLSSVEEGRTELELAAELEYRLRTAGSVDRPFASIVAAGERSALPHASPSSRVVREGDLLLADFGATMEGYVSDLTRCAVLGVAAPWQRELHAAVDGAREAAIGAAVAGAPASEVDGAARARLEEAGWLEQFGHSTGHGIGLEVHEGPSVSERSEEILRAGNVVTIEPGVYLRGRGGVRLEDDVLVEEGGARVLTTARRDLREL